MDRQRGASRNLWSKARLKWRGKRLNLSTEQFASSAYCSLNIEKNSSFVCVYTDSCTLSQSESSGNLTYFPSASRLMHDSEAHGLGELIVSPKVNMARCMSCGVPSRVKDSKS